MRHLAATIAAAMIAASVVGCASPPEAADAATSSLVPGGNPERGQRAIADYGCGSCHVIPGIDGATGMVGPPLTGWSRRTVVAGEVPNTPDQLVRWLIDPQAIEPKTAMPNLGVTQAHAADIAAYLYSIK